MKHHYILLVLLGLGCRSTNDKDSSPHINLFVNQDIKRSASDVDEAAYDNTLGLLQIKLETNKNSADLNYEVARVLLVKGDCNKGRAHARKALFADRLHVGSLLILFDCYIREGRFELAEQMLGRLEEAGNKKYFQERTALLAYVRGNYHQAYEQMLAALDSARVNLPVSSALNAGIALAKIGRLDEAKSVAGKILETDIKYADVKLFLAMMLSIDGNHEDALRVYQDLFKQYPRREMVELNYSMALARAGNKKEAVKRLQILIQETKDKTIKERGQLAIKYITAAS